MFSNLGAEMVPLISPINLDHKADSIEKKCIA